MNTHSLGYLFFMTPFESEFLGFFMASSHPLGRAAPSEPVHKRCLALFRTFRRAIVLGRCNEDENQLWV